MFRMWKNLGVIPQSSVSTTIASRETASAASLRFLGIHSTSSEMPFLCRGRNVKILLGNTKPLLDGLGNTTKEGEIMPDKLTVFLKFLKP